MNMLWSLAFVFLENTSGAPSFSSVSGSFIALMILDASLIDYPYLTLNSSS